MIENKSSKKISSQILAMEVLRKLGYKYISHEENIAFRNEMLNNVLLEEILMKKLNEINSYEYNGVEYKFSQSTIEQAVKDLNEELLTGLINTNEKIYDMLTLGRTYTEKMIDGTTRSFNIKYIDFDNLENNDFYVTEEFPILKTNGKEPVKLDVVAFVNGIPLAVIECVEPSRQIEYAISQNIKIQRNDYIPQFFKFIQIIMSVNENESKYATCGTPAKSWATWKEQNIEEQNEIFKMIGIEREITKQDRDIVSLFKKDRFLELIRDFIIFEDGSKKICRYQQYFAVKATLNKIKQENRGGVIWHTTGSGKSLTMIYITKKIMKDIYRPNSQVVVVTDRVVLDAQIHRSFNRVGIPAKRAATGTELIQLIEDDNIRIITTVINKFEAVVKSGIKIDAKNTFIIIDECHRSQYGSINKKMQKVFEGAIYISFTGTPIMKKDRNTFDKFGGLIHKYSLNEALEDKVILPLVYKGIRTNQEFTELGDNRRLELIASDIANNYNEKLKDTEFNAMFACNNINEAIKYYNIFKSKFPELRVALVISIHDVSYWERKTEDINTATRDFYEEIRKDYKNEREYETIVKAKFIEGEIDILIVVNKLLTGFDAPRMSTLYLDKLLKGHNLLQAIARVNRPYEGKECGYIIDYRGLLVEFDETLSMYQDVELGQFEKEDIEKSVYHSVEEIENQLNEGTDDNKLKEPEEEMQRKSFSYIREDSEIYYPLNMETEDIRPFYEVIYKKLVPKMNVNIDIKELWEIALAIQKEIENKVKVDWHNNKDIYNELAQFIDDTIYTYKSRRDINLSFDEIDEMIEEIMKIALIRY